MRMRGELVLVECGLQACWAATGFEKGLGPVLGIVEAKMAEVSVG
jgi:hypothetical protein